MPKAYIYKNCPYGSRNEFVCAVYDNGKEIISIPHSIGGIYLQHMDRPVILGETGINILALPGADSSIETDLDVGQAIKYVWRPGLRVNIETVLETKIDERAKSKIDLKILMQKLDEILLYLEPTADSLNTYGHKLRELLILSCTEIENSWGEYLKLSGLSITRPTTNEYVRLKSALFLAEFEIRFSRHPFIKVLRPFESWDATNPTTSLPWYDAYNQTKHSKNDNFNKSTLENCLNAIAANIIMFCVKYGPYEITAGNDNFANIINESFEISLNNPDLKSFYIPKMEKHTHSEPGNAFVKTWTDVSNGWNWDVLPFSL
ncbi:MAG: hypothetical protein JW985_01565 [Alphaproteobacteria bacterium]|nr:hypothetical protein [Alphaproteobacteria bacterium]